MGIWGATAIAAVQIQKEEISALERQDCSIFTSAWRAVTWNSKGLYAASSEKKPLKNINFTESLSKVLLSTAERFLSLPPEA